MTTVPPPSDRLFTERENFLVVLDSRNATEYRNGTMHSSVHFDLTEPIRRDKFAISMTCSVLQFQAPNSLYHVNATNNTLKVTINNGATTTYSLPYGNYNASTFITAVLSLLPAGFGMTLNALTNKFTLTYSTAFTLTGTVAPVMGFDVSTSLSSVSNALTMPFTCNFNGLQSFNIHFKSVVTKNIDSFNKSYSSIIQSVPVQVGSNSISYVKNADFNIVIAQETIDDVQIDLLDDSNNYLDFNNCHWNMQLYFSVTKDTERYKYANNFHTIMNGVYY